MLVIFVDERGLRKAIDDIFNVNRSSPKDGKIKIAFKPAESAKVGDQVQVQVDLTSPGTDFSQMFWVKIVEPQAEPPKRVQPVEEEEDKIGLPNLVKVYRVAPEGDDVFTWERLDGDGIEMNYDTVIHPLIEVDVLQTIYINMDSNVLKNYRSKLRSLEQHQVADRRYVTAIYFHTLFLYAINKQRGYEVGKSDRDDEFRRDEFRRIDLTEYLKDLFSSSYAAFLLNFGTGELLEALG